MTRAVVFDPTDGELFYEQTQRLDWRLLQNGSVFCYRSRYRLDHSCAELTSLGYLVHRIDAGACGSIDDLHTALAHTLDFPNYYGRNMDAFNDVLGDVSRFRYGSDPLSTGTVVAMAGYTSIEALDARSAITLLDIFASNARRAAFFGHPLLCLIETATNPNDFGTVGGSPVLEAGHGIFEPDGFEYGAGTVVDPSCR